MINTVQQPPHHLIIFVRFPGAGKAKTRLIPALGRKGAADLQRRMTEHLLQRLHPLFRDENIHCSISYTGGTAQKMKTWLGDGLAFRKQEGDDLGQRMLHAFAGSRTIGARHTILLGSDCPAVDDHVIRTAFAGLSRHDLVIGPAADGGYYLIGMNNRCEPLQQNFLFTDISWGTHRVFQQTIERAQETKQTWLTLPILHDIDRPEDLEHFDYHPRPE